MGANAQTSVPLFVANSVLTAAQQNISAATGVPVFATTVTRDAAFGGSNKALAEGQLCYIEASDVVQYYTGAAWATVGPATPGALTLITAQTIGSAVGSVTVSGAFSATYDNYKISISGGLGSASANLGIQLGSTTTGYYYGYSRTTSYTSATYDGQVASNTSAFLEVGFGSTNSLVMNVELLNPNLAKPTFINFSYLRSDTTAVGPGAGAGFLSGTTQYTAFTITPSVGTITGGTIRVYGYSNS